VRRDVIGILRRTVSEFRDDNMTDWAAALTYYGLLSIFPALIAFVSIVGLFADPRETTQALTDVITDIGPESSASTFRGPIESLTSHREAAGILLVVGILTALYSASGYIGAYTRAMNVIYETPEGRSFWELKPLQLLIALAMVIGLMLVALSLALTGPVVDAVAEAVGIGDTPLAIWNIAKWPVIAGLFCMLLAFLNYTTPNAKLRGLRWVTPGSLFALVIWIAASALFALYVANFGSYDKTYGTLGGIVSLLVWIWITNVAILLGAELNSERERARELEEGKTEAVDELQLPPRRAP
jgi:membrane protein